MALRGIMHFMRYLPGANPVDVIPSCHIEGRNAIGNVIEVVLKYY